MEATSRPPMRPRSMRGSPATARSTRDSDETSSASLPQPRRRAPAGARLPLLPLLEDRVAVRPAGEDPVLRTVRRLRELLRHPVVVDGVGVVDAVVDGAAFRREPRVDAVWTPVRGAFGGADE